MKKLLFGFLIVFQSCSQTIDRADLKILDTDLKATYLMKNSLGLDSMSIKLIQKTQKN